MPFVSRAGEKLDHALKTFKLEINDLVCADFGSNAGGFVDCLILAGAKRVYAVETGYGILDWKLRNDGRVIVMERTNAMHVELPEKVDLITIDTSWTKLKNIIPNALENLKLNGRIIALVKPHYEAGPKMIRKGKLPDEHILIVLNEVKAYLNEFGLKIINDTESPILGSSGKNREYLFYLQRNY